MYTVNYFIKKFQAIPEEQWCTNLLTSSDGKRHCAFGHCGVKPHSNSNYIFSEEGEALNTLFVTNNLDVIGTNDSRGPGFTHISTAKERILAALHMIKGRQPQVEISDSPVTIEDIIGEQVVVC